MTSRSEELFGRARRVLPGGVNSPVRAFKSVGGVPRFIRSARGAYLEDADRNRYLDFMGSWGVAILGHDHPEVRDAAARALTRGTSFGAPSPDEVEIAELIAELVPGIEVVRFVNSGTEATMSAIRLARAVTGRSRIVKFRGGYHGHADAFLVAAGSGAATLGVPSSPGVPPATARQTSIAQFNDLASVEDCFSASEAGVAAVIVEPVAGNMGCVPPADGFLAGLRDLCTRHGALLIFDEVMTGFRVGLTGAQGRYDVTPDLTTLGKVIGGGLPVGAYGGRGELMREIAPDGPVYQAGTLSGNPLAMAAGLAAMRHLAAHPEIYDHTEHLGRLLDRGFAEIGAHARVSIRWNRVGAMGSLFFSESPVVDWPSSEASSSDRFNRLFHGMLDRGIYLPPSSFEAWFWSAAHEEPEIARALQAAAEIIHRMDAQAG
ncbi:MAG: glutamate-1-semialdehyde 2,1-aminomutase [Gammaproteobacteria bacterium]|nr:glutamate-1-semialdehyde 2,1-aminomutase [Gammaproteobacteria bacterium]